jgi:predicted lipid carrier protein YhbT
MGSSQAVPSSSLLRTLSQEFSNLLLSSVPLAAIQPILGRIAVSVAQARPELFARLGSHAGKRFLIDPVDLPFVLVLTPEPDWPKMTAHRRHENPVHDAAISGRFMDLLGMIDGSLDGDALFFTRDLRVSGDTEAVVALRNALDDFEGSALDHVLEAFGPFARPAALALSTLRSLQSKTRHG